MEKILMIPKSKFSLYILQRAPNKKQVAELAVTWVGDREWASKAGCHNPFMVACLISPLISLWQVKSEDTTFIGLQSIQVTLPTRLLSAGWKQPIWPRLPSDRSELGCCCGSGQISLISYSSPCPEPEDWTAHDTGKYRLSGQHTLF